MKLKENGARIVGLVIDYVNGEIDRWEFDLDYSGYVVDYFPAFEREHPRLARRFADTIEWSYANCSWMSNDQFRDEMADALARFAGKVKEIDLL